ncbi:MAG: serine protease [Acidimicrobiia bacterium]|nr:serine protease [Acidimicrobiia bacterium]
MTNEDGRWLLVALVLTVVTTFVVAVAMREPAPSYQLAQDIPGPRLPPTTLPPPTTGPPSTTVPEVEALIPLTVDALRDDVAQSVGFVLSQQGTGSGVVISEDLVLTNAHVAWPDSTVSLVFRNGATFQGRVIALDPFIDLAVVDISRLTRKPPPIAIGSTADLEVGDELHVIGYPAPDEFTPEPTIDSGEVLGFTDWEFTGVGWFTIDAPAVGGQSGGAVVDEFGRVVGISTFGSSVSLTSISIDDALAEVDRLLTEPNLRGLEPRALPRAGARRSNAMGLEGPWDQQLLLGWFGEDANVRIDWEEGEGELVVKSIDGVTITRGPGRVEFSPVFAFPVVVAATADGAAGGSLESSLPLIVYDDPDHGKVLPRGGALSGVYEVGGDRDYFYLTLDQGESVSIIVESAARTRLFVYDPAAEVVASDRDTSGFIASDAEVEFVAAESGRYVVAVESSMATVSGYTIATS